MNTEKTGDMRAVDYLANFEPETRSQIIEFGKLISSAELSADVYLIMARKAICFVDMLIQFDLARLNGLIVTDRILDTNISWLTGKSVTIIDDALVSGTTIWKTIEKLKTVVDVNHIKVCVLSINNEWYKKEPPEMLSRVDGTDGRELYKSFIVKPYNFQTNEKCMRTCFDIVKALSKTPKPYDIDFPLYEDLPINKTKINELLNSSWTPINVSSIDYESDKYSKSNTQAMSVKSICESISFFPPQDVIKKICSIFGIQELSNNGALKMRTYIRGRTKNKTEFHITYLPFAILDNLSYTEIDKIYLNISRQISNSKELDHWFISYSSKFRFIQFIIGATLAREFFATNGIYKIEPKSVYPTFPKFSYKRANYIFPYEVVKLIENFNTSGKFFKDSGYKLITSESINKKYILPTNILLISEKMSKLFLKLYYEQELPARTLAKKYGNKVFDIADYKKIVNRLDRGYTYKQILEIAEGNRFAEYIVSAFLDYAIDIGTAVPITCSHVESISRAYRHGEDVIFSDEEAKLLSHMLLTFINNFDSKKDIGGVLLEKLLTSFIRMGIVFKIFDKFDYNKIYYQTREYLRITYNLHGSTVRRYFNSTNNENKVLLKPYVTADDKSKWLWEILVDKGLLKKKEISKKYDETGYAFCMPNVSELKIQEIAGSKKGLEAERIAEIVGFCFKKKILNQNDLILLNATNGYDEIMPALLAEIEIIKKEFPNNKYLAQQAFKEWHTFNWLKSNRDSKLFIAMNSGKWKYDAFINGFARSLVEKVDIWLNNNASRDLYRNWHLIWHENLDNVREEQTSKVIVLLNKEASYIIQFGLIYRLLELLAFYKTIGETCITQYFSDLKSALLSVKGLKEKKDIIKRFNEELGEKKLSHLKSYFEISRVEINTRSINSLDKIEKLKQAYYLKQEIEKYIDILQQIIIYTNYGNAQLLINKVKSMLLRNEFVIDDLNFLLNHADNLNSSVDKLQKLVSIYINLQGKIEKPIIYNNIAVIDFTNDEAENLQIETIKLIDAKRKKLANKDNIDLLYQRDDSSIIIFTSGIAAEEVLIRLIKEINYSVNLENQLSISVFRNVDEIYAPFRYESSLTTANIWNFYEFYNKIEKELSKINYAFAIITLNDDKCDDCLKMLKEYHSSSANLTIDKMELKINYISKENNMIETKKGFTICIVCAKDTELDGVRLRLCNKFNIQFEEEFDSLENYRRNLCVEINIGKITHRIILTLCDQGNIGSAVTYNSLAHLKPDYIFFCGIAGTCDDKITIGDVCIPFKIFDSTLKKEMNDGYQLRATVYDVCQHHKGLILSFIDEFKKFAKANNKKFKLLNIDAVSDNTVYAVDDSEVLKKVLTFNDKIGCIEMEAAGMLYSDIERGKTKYGVYFIRGISDRANALKKDKYHKYAIENASMVMGELLDFLFKHFEFIDKMKI